jgi:diguanylate cyclase (GGDEF)-like protein/PAS domain S-box-containing protein
MAEEDRFYKDIIDNLYDGVYFVDRDRVITYWNKGAERITGYTRGQVVGHACRENLLNHVSPEGVLLCETRCPLAACMEDGKVREAEVFLHHVDGHRVPVLVRLAPLRDKTGGIIGAVETFSSSTALMRARRKLRELRHTANTDSLTGTGNRGYLEGRLHAVIAELHYQKETSAGLLFMDIDFFKRINDTRGHDTGDKVLRMVAATLRHNLRKGDSLGRWGGEEFLAILYDLASPDALKSISEKLRTLVAFSRLDLSDKSVTVTISIGATLFLATDTPESAVSRADALMYQSKRNGRNRVSVG